MDRLLFAANVLIGYRVEVQVRQKVLLEGVCVCSLLFSRCAQCRSTPAWLCLAGYGARDWELVHAFACNPHFTLVPMQPPLAESAGQDRLRL